MLKKFVKPRFKSAFVTLAASAFCLGISLTACKKKSVEETTTPTPAPSPSTGNDSLSTTTVATNLDTPWQMAFAPDGRMFFTERLGRVRVIENGQLKPQPYLNLRDTIIEAGEAGLTGIAIDPKFAENHFLYFTWSYQKSLNPLVIMNKVVRYREDVTTKLPVWDKVLLDNIEGYVNHNTGSMHFGPDDYIYITVGERYIPEYAQDLKKLNGKILRITRDGAIPSNNPFPESAVYTYGHRNPQGLAWQPVTNNLFNLEHGPSQQQGCCQDEINLIEPGKNYGWPVIRGAQKMADMETPVYNSGDTVTWAPCQGVFLKSGPWQGSLLFTGLFDKALHRAIFDPANPRKIIREITYMKGELGRLRAITLGPDGKIYIGTSNGDGRGIAVNPNDDRILILNIK